jgi:hypothetical protein
VVLLSSCNFLIYCACQQRLDLGELLTLFVIVSLFLWLYCNSIYCGFAYQSLKWVLPCYFHLHFLTSVGHGIVIILWLLKLTSSTTYSRQTPPLVILHMLLFCCCFIVEKTKFWANYNCKSSTWSFCCFEWWWGL